MTQPTKAQIQKWVKALRSGRYKQSKNELHNKYGYCCLGVACKLFIPRHKRVLRKDKFVFGIYPVDQPFSPKWLKDVNDVFAKKSLKNLPVLNDLEELTFNEIADCLELVFIHKALG